MPWDKVDEKYLGKCLCGARARCCGGTYRKGFSTVHGTTAVCDRCGDTCRGGWAVGKECHKGICTVSGRDKVACPRRKVGLAHGA